MTNALLPVGAGITVIVPFPFERVYRGNEKRRETKMETKSPLGGAAQDNLLASVTVRQNGIAFDSPPPDRESSKNGAFIRAWPNPVPAGTKPGKTTISWSTGDGSKGVIRVLMKSHRIQYPPDGGEAIEQLETLRAKGGEFLLIRRELVSWLEDYKGLKEHLDRQYRIIQDDEVCRIYDLRGTN